jgi:hypothetical protein
MKQQFATLLRRKTTWICLMLCVAGIYLIGLYLLISPTTRLAGLFLLIGVISLHLAELKIAIRIGREFNIPVSRIFIMDMVFGFTWWLPLKNGINIR